jgi:hypothetical protein
MRNAKASGGLPEFRQLTKFRDENAMKRELKVRACRGINDPFRSKLCPSMAWNLGVGGSLISP